MPRNPNRRPYREFLLPREAAALYAMDERAKELKTALAKNTQQRDVIIRRCIRRANDEIRVRRRKSALEFLASQPIFCTPTHTKEARG